MCYITATELKNNLAHYMELSATEDVYVTKNSKIITVLSNPDKHKLFMIDELRGSVGKVDENIDFDELLKEEILERAHLG